MIIIIATVATVATAALPTSVTGSLNLVMAQGQNMTADIGGGFVPGNATSGNASTGNTMSGNMTEAEGTNVNETGFINSTSMTELESIPTAGETGSIIIDQEK